MASRTSEVERVPGVDGQGLSAVSLGVTWGPESESCTAGLTAAGQSCRIRWRSVNSLVVYPTVDCGRPCRACRVVPWCSAEEPGRRGLSLLRLPAYCRSADPGAYGALSRMRPGPVAFSGRSPCSVAGGLRGRQRRAKWYAMSRVVVARVRPSIALVAGWPRRAACSSARLWLARGVYFHEAR